MSANGIKAVIFDLGNVLIDFDYYIAINRLLSFTDKTPAQIFELFFDSKLTSSFEEAGISPEDFFLRVKEALGLKLDYAGFLPIWNEIFFLSPKNERVYKLAKRLEKNYPLALVTNINVLHLDYIRKKFPVLGPFRNITASCEVRSTKPSPVIYKKALESLGVEPKDAFYTDDRPELIEGARRLGINGFVFEGIDKLQQDLVDSGINLN